MEIKVFATRHFDYQNTLVVNLDEENVFIVDPSGEFSLDGKNPVAVILTHGHYDHVEALKPFHKNYPDVPILIHKEDAKYIGKDSFEAQQHICFDDANDFANLPEATGFLSEGQTLYDVIPSKNERLHNALALWKVLHTPGHSPGSICLLNEKERVLISGDTLFFHSYGRTDFFDGSMSEMTKSLRRLYNLDGDLKVYPGHGTYGYLLAEDQY